MERAHLTYARSRGLKLLLQKNVGDVGVWQLEARLQGRDMAWSLLMLALDQC